jgi:hypothetical protein
MKLNITWKIFIGMTLGIIVGYFIHHHFDLGQFISKDAALHSPEQLKANEGIKSFQGAANDLKVGENGNQNYQTGVWPPLGGDPERSEKADPREATEN